ncbi:MAG: hypothetical protein IJC74_00945 [Clostridia bacterium]|nr:hypothetical protein [Clostridia bacterium]
MKKNISVILAVVLLISSFSFVSAKDTNADYILADFSLGDETSFDFISDEGGTSHKNNITDTVKRYGKESSLKWDFAGGNKSLKVTKGTLGNFLDYDYFYAWIYSTSANNQPLVSLFRDHSIDKYVSNNSTVVCDYKGWKLHQIDISGYTLKSFTADAIAEHDFQFFFRNTGWGVTAIGDTVMYIDSIFLSNNDYLAAGEEIITTYFQNGATDVEATNLITLSASPAFKSDSQYYDDKVTVLKDGNALTDGYSIDFEYTKAYVQFDEVLESGAEYTIQFDENAVMSDGTVIGNKGTISFTIAEKELELGAITFTNGTTEIDAPPASGKVVATVNAKNISDDSITAVLIIGVYDKTTNRMLTMDVSESITLLKNEDDDFTAEVTLDSYENCYVRAFLWDSENGMYSYGEYGEI